MDKPPLKSFHSSGRWLCAEKLRMRSKYRIFTNDRGTKHGIPMYSALKEVKAASPAEARTMCPPQFDAPNYAPAMAIHWPAQSDSEKEWLKKHVGKGL